MTITTGFFYVSCIVTLNGNINIKSCVHWADLNLHAMAPVSLHDMKVIIVYYNNALSFVFDPCILEEATSIRFVPCSEIGSHHTVRLEKLHYTRSTIKKCSIYHIISIQDLPLPKAVTAVHRILPQDFSLHYHIIFYFHGLGNLLTHFCRFLFLRISVI